MKIKVINNIDDPFLKEEWERLETETDVFPQSTYNWSATWWRHMAGRRKLNVVMVLDEDGKALGIAPLCIERNFGVSTLRSFPVHFGDFFEFIMSAKCNVNNAINLILDYMLSYKMWKWVRLENLYEDTQLTQVLAKRLFLKKRMTGCVSFELCNFTWTTYLSKLKKKFRNEIKRRLRKINLEFVPVLRSTTNCDNFRYLFEGMIATHNARWITDNVPTKGKNELTCWKIAIGEQFLKNNMIYFELFLDNIPVAYRLGFIKNGIFYAWHTGFHPDYRRYHVGQLLMAFMIQHFLITGISKVNFMAGDYEWKLDWSPDRKSHSICQFTSPSNNIAAFFLNTYHHYLRDKLKVIYHRLMEFKIFRTLSRATILLKQKITGLR